MQDLAYPVLLPKRKQSRLGNYTEYHIRRPRGKQVLYRSHISHYALVRDLCVSVLMYVSRREGEVMTLENNLGGKGRFILERPLLVSCHSSFV